MTDPSDLTFDQLCEAVRRKIMERQGAHHAKDFLLLLKLIRILGTEKVDRPVVPS